ncbi:sensor histidine kinase [Colwellia sp. Arc7-635]|uniref:sensor histidine kinase n=1 Tax=Colwellia sp. Arc7-635 TaxID=2497879 RepID=UPI000F85B6C5|nr:ATP-binding protein [Colwellia sp. Arc7-635]AZQ85247.1 sensor histidine kinase [Colwellia sp. Arc7-635]
MNSIKKKLSKYISISVSILLVGIFLVTDILVDTWISNEFDRAMKTKAGLLTTLISEDLNEVDFDFAGEFMPEFEGKNDPEYYQLWRDNKVFERSDTLDLFELHDLPKLNAKLHETIIKDITLPDGRSGKMLFIKFIPQIDSDIREDYGVTKEEFSKTQKTMELAYAISNEGLNQILWFVDVIFIITSLLSIISVQIIVSKVVSRGLRPLVKLNKELKQVNLNSDVSSLSTDQLPEELIDIANGINGFINENKKLYSREKRITSDIAHELKTPIAELLNLSEVAIKFPHEKQITDNFYQDVLEISERLKNIVNGILLLKKSSNTGELVKKDLDIKELINTIVNRENKSRRKIDQSYDDKTLMVFTNETAIDTILSNLINNAIYYSPIDSLISIVVTSSSENKLNIKICNKSTHQYDNEDLNSFFEPLWQKDESRTSSQRFGLGLAIVKSYSEKIGSSISVSKEQDQRITFTLTL